MCNIEFQVYFNETTLASNKRAFDRIVSVPDACSVPYETIIKALRFLFGASVIINFKIFAK